TGGKNRYFVDLRIIECISERLAHLFWSKVNPLADRQWRRLVVDPDHQQTHAGGLLREKARNSNKVGSNCAFTRHPQAFAHYTIDSYRRQAAVAYARLGNEVGRA